MTEPALAAPRWGGSELSLGLGHYSGVEERVQVALDGADDRRVQDHRVDFFRSRRVVIPKRWAFPTSICTVPSPGSLHVVQDMILDVDRPVVVDPLG